MMVGEMAVPALLQGDQIVIEQTGSATDPRFNVAGAQNIPPVVAGGTAPPVSTSTGGSVPTTTKPGDLKPQTPEEIAALKDEANKKAALDAAIKQAPSGVQIVTNK